MVDVSGILKSTVGAGLEREALKQFGNAVENYSVGLLGGLVKNRGPLAPGDTSSIPVPTDKVWEPTNYASAIARVNRHMPRLKFLFKVRFEFDPSILEYLSSLSQKTVREIEESLTFVVKSVDKPKFDYEYEEVNMYNFRTKVLKKINNRELNMSFHDDDANTVFDFITMYQRALHPIARLSNADMLHNSLHDHGFSFGGEDGSAGDITSVNTSYRASFDTAVNILKKITVFQYYNNGTATNALDNVKVNKFVFVNPRLTNIDYDDLDHEQGGTFGIATINFDFDALFMESNKPAWGPDSGLDPEYPHGDILFGKGANPDIEKKPSLEITQSGQKNPFVEVLARQGQRAVQTALQSALNKKFGNSIAGRALGGTFATVTGALGNAVSGTIRGAASGFSLGSLIKQPPAPVTDSSVPPAEATQNASSTPSSTLQDYYP